MRTIVISDIHGCNKTFQKALKNIGFTKEDQLILLGDYIDRGPDSKGVLDHIFYLKENGYNLVCLLGNHEKMFMEARWDRGELWSWISAGGGQTLESFPIRQLQKIEDKYFDFLDSLLPYFEKDKYIFVHAGLNMKIEDPFNDKEAMLWMRNLDAHLNTEWLAGRHIIHGHTPLFQERIELRFTHFESHSTLNIDNGCVFDRKGLGSLCVLNLTDMELHFVANID